MVNTGQMQSGAGASGSESVSGELIGKLLDSLDSIVFIADIETNEILFANSSMRRICGFDPIGRDCRELIHQSQGECCDFCNNARIMGGDGKPGGILSREYLNRFNKRWYSARAQALEWSGGRYVRIEVWQDITEYKRLQRLLYDARQQTKVAIDTKNRFVALVAHDLKSPFVSILGMLKRILRKETFQYEVHRQFLENIINNGQRTMKMIDNLLDMDRLETGKIKPEPSFFDLYEMVEEVFENFAHLAEIKQLLLSNNIPAATEIYADRYLYMVVLNNLISNAVKFSFASGRIVVSYEANDTHTRLIVKDEGRGIPKEYLEDIFRPDVKTTSKGTSGETGSGLGLVFCQQIMKAHGGLITLESVEGAGSTFYVELCPSCKLPEPVSLLPRICKPSGE